jgi:hypothetical protein
VTNYAGVYVVAALAFPVLYVVTLLEERSSSRVSAMRTAPIKATSRASSTFEAARGRASVFILMGNAIPRE